MLHVTVEAVAVEAGLSGAASPFFFGGGGLWGAGPTLNIFWNRLFLTAVCLGRGGDGAGGGGGKNL